MPQRTPPPLGDPWLAHYASGLRAHTLQLQRCIDCGHVRHPPGPVCPECWSENTEWQPHSGQGEVTSFVWYMESLHPRFTEVPYNVALVRLDGGPVLVSTVCATAPGDLCVGDRVRATFSDEAGGFSILLFEKEGEA